MVLLSSAIPLILLCSAHAFPLANRSLPTITAPVKHHRGGKARDIAAASQSRARSFRSSGKSTSATNVVVSYVVTLTIGGQDFPNVIVDTGSSNTWVNASTPYIPSSTSHNTGAAVSVTYASGSFSGTEFTDTVTLGPVIAVAQSIGVANTSDGFEPGSMALSASNMVEGRDRVPTLMETLVHHGQIQRNVLGVSFEPEKGTDNDDANGQLTFGGIDTTKFTGAITYVPVSQNPNLAGFRAIDNVSAAFGSIPLSGSLPYIVDTGTTLIVLPDPVFAALSSATGATVDQDTGFIVFPTLPADDFHFAIGGAVFTLTSKQYLIPEEELELFGLDKGEDFFSFFTPLGDRTSAQGVFLGQKFLENFYSVYDADNQVVGFANRG